MDYDFLTKNTYDTWVLCFVDSNDNKWFGWKLFPTRLDAKRWGQHMKNDLHVCVAFRTYLLQDVLTSIEASTLITNF